MNLMELTRLKTLAGIISEVNGVINLNIFEIKKKNGAMVTKVFQLHKVKMCLLM